MKTNYTIFLKYREDAFKRLKLSYESKIVKARNKIRVSTEFYDSLTRTEYPKVQNELGEYSRVIILINDELEIDNGKEFENLFNTASNSFPIKSKSKIIKLLAELNAMDKFFKYWNDLDLNSSKSKEISLNEKIIWKGNNETEFIQLIYMLYHANLLSNERNEITKLVKQIAEVFNYELGKNWQTNLSASKQKRKNGYQPEIIDKLNNAWEVYSNNK
jgi:hypothetical protein